MQVRPVGSVRCWHVLNQRRKSTRSTNIVIFYSAGFDGRYLINELFAVARHFADRTIIVKLKPGHLLSGWCSEELELLFAPPNVRISEDDATI